MVTVIRCQKCGKAYEYVGPRLLSNPLIECENCQCQTRGTPYVLNHGTEIDFQPTLKAPLKRELLLSHIKPAQPTDAQKESAHGPLQDRSQPYRPIPELTEKEKAKFDSLYDRKAEDQCWRWKGGRDAAGYGSFNMRAKRFVASRVMWLLVYGEDPEDYQIGHTCDNPPCCNPNHLFLTDHAGNALDKALKGRCHNQKTDSHSSDD